MTPLWRPFEKLSRAAADTQSCRLLRKPHHRPPQVPPGQGAPVTVPGEDTDLQGKHEKRRSSQALACPWSYQSWVSPPCLVDTGLPVCTLALLTASRAQLSHEGPQPKGPAWMPVLPAQGTYGPAGHPRPWTFPTWGCRALQGHPLP